MTTANSTQRPPRRTRRAVMVAGCAIALGACNLLEVSNPNNVSEEALDNPAGAGPLVSGLVASVVRGVHAIMSSYATATDELTWSGSRDAWNQIDRGGVGDPFNEFIDNAFKYVAEARFMANNTIDRLVGFGFDSDDAQSDRKTLMVRAYLHAAVIYAVIGDQFDDFAFSTKTEAGPNVGPDKMIQFYDSATAYLDRALALAQTEDEEAQILTMRARVKHGRAVWQLLNPSKATPPANPFVNDAGANADARAALALIGGTDFRFQLTMLPELNVGDLSIGGQVNSRQEMRLSDTYIIYDPKQSRVQDKVVGAAIKDPIAGIPDPELDRAVHEFTDAISTPPLTMSSEREMYLILAEAALATGNTAEFDKQINALRALDKLPAYAGSGVTRQQLLLHHRQTSLFLQGRRLADLYRFGLTADRWAADEDAAQCKGIFFPITVTELQSNTLVESITGCGH